MKRSRNVATNSFQYRSLFLLPLCCHDDDEDGDDGDDNDDADDDDNDDCYTLASKHVLPIWPSRPAHHQNDT